MKGDCYSSNFIKFHHLERPFAGQRPLFLPLAYLGACSHLDLTAKRACRGPLTWGRSWIKARNASADGSQGAKAFTELRPRILEATQRFS